MKKQGADLYVIGGGIVGLCAALHLQSRGCLVAILEAQKIGGGASFGNAGHLAVEQIFPIADMSILRQLPAMLFDDLGPLRLDWRYLPTLLPWAMQLLFAMRPSAFARSHQALKQINAVSLKNWQDFAQHWQLQTWVHTQGSLLTAEKKETLVKLQAHGKKLADLGVVNEYLSQSALKESQPALADNQLGALFFPQTGHVSDLPAMMARLIKHFADLGGQVHENCQVDGVQVGVDGVHLQTSQGQILAPRILISAGAYSKRLVSQATGVRVPLDTERGYHLMLPNVHKRLSMPVTSMDRRFIMTPMVSGLRLAGTVEFAGLHRPPNMARANMLLDLARPMFAEPLDESTPSAWMGFRPSTADSLPVIDSVGRVLLNFGHQHLGLTQAVTSAMLIGDMYFGYTPAIDVAPYRLSRFGVPIG